MKKILALLLVLAVLFMTGCKKQEPEQVTTEVTTQKPEKVYYNFLTGEKRSSKKTPRPVAVTVNNIEASLPQYGISEADIIMEFPAEGGITRLMALYSDYADMPNVCSVRSCRYYFPVFAQGFGAVYFCFGSNETLGTPMLEKLGIDHIDGNKVGDSLVFERDEERLYYYSLEHTAYLKGENMKKIFKEYNFSTELPEGVGETAFDFSQSKLVLADKCEDIIAKFSGYYESRFTYDKKLGAYLKQHNGEPHMDGKSDKQLAFENVLLLETEVKNYMGTVLIELDWKGGMGCYLTNGTVMPVIWEKQSESSPIKLFDMYNKPIKINTGKTYIGVGVSSAELPLTEEAE